MRPLTAKRRLKSKVSASGIIANGVTNSSPDEAQANLISQDASPSSPNKTHSRHRLDYSFSKSQLKHYGTYTALFSFHERIVMLCIHHGQYVQEADTRSLLS